jgi:cytochrome c biogenesis protein CcdA/thiol-disulfide isomerase/thioredoxin
VIVLIGFALLAGAGTAISPCVLPVLPALLSAGATGGRRRPLGVVVGLVATFTLTVVGVASVVHGVGLAGGFLRTFAILVLLGFGVSLIVPSLAARLEAPLSRLARFGPRSTGTGFWSGTVVGAAFGFVYAPCAGPILAAVISVSASRGTSLELVLIALAYGIGSGAVLLALTSGGRRLAERVRRAGRGPSLQRGLGGIMVLTAVLMLAMVDVRFEQALAKHFPDVTPTAGLESSGAVDRRLADLRGHPKFDSGHVRAAQPASPGAAPGTPRLPDLGAAPNFTGTQRWFNTAGGRPLSLTALRGRVVLVDFWTYTCINCVRTLPFLRGLDAKYRRDGLTIVGVHTPEFSFEQDAGNVASAVRSNGLRYPVAQDNRYGTWNAYGNQYWPAEYLIDARGHVRHTNFGEGGYHETELAIRALLTQAGHRGLGGMARGRPILPTAQEATPETYLGADRAQGWVGVPPTPGTRAYPATPGLGLNDFALFGTWRVTGQSATAVRNAQVDVLFQAAHVYLVLSSAGDRPRPVRVLLDGRPLGARNAGVDAPGGTVTVRAQRLYELVSLPAAEQHRLTLRFAPGVAGYAFTFG